MAFFLQMALEMLGWNSEETRFPLEGRILFTQPNDANWKKVWTVKMASIQTLLCVLSPDNLPEVTSNKELIFPPESTTIKDVSLIMVREKNAKYTLVRVRHNFRKLLILSNFTAIFLRIRFQWKTASFAASKIGTTVLKFKNLSVKIPTSSR